MSNHPHPAGRPADVGASYYRALLIAGLVGVLLVCFHLDLGGWSFLPFLVGIVGLVTGWRGTPPVLLLALALCLNRAADWLFYRGSAELLLSELVLCVAVLTCVAAHYRLQGLTVRLLPIDPRTRPGFFGRLLEFLSPKPAAGPPPPRRSGALVSQAEIVRLAMTLPLWAGLAVLVWNALPVERAQSPLARYGIPSPWWRVMLLTWMIGLALWVTAGLLGYWKRRQLTRAAAILYLQDIVWRQTHREQRSVNRWLAWRRLRQQRKDTP
jgi:hypothetical protein